MQIRPRNPFSAVATLGLALVMSCEASSSNPAADSVDPALTLTTVVFTVRSAESGRPIPAASIMVTIGGATTGVITDATGNASISAAPGIATVAVSAPTFRSVTEVVAFPNASTPAASFEVLLEELP